MAQFFYSAGPTMEVGTILSWRKAEGDALELKTSSLKSKRTKRLEIEIFDSGYLLVLKEKEPKSPQVDPLPYWVVVPTKTFLNCWRASLSQQSDSTETTPSQAKDDTPTPAPASATPSTPTVATGPVGGGLQPFTWQGRSHRWPHGNARFLWTMESPYRSPPVAFESVLPGVVLRVPKAYLSITFAEQALVVG